MVLTATPAFSAIASMVVTPYPCSRNRSRLVELHEVLSEGDIVAFRSAMTGTHQGLLQLGPGPAVPPTGRAISGAHMHFVKMVNGKGVDLWHVWDNLGLLQQVGVLPGMREPVG
jgi:hypothetical protein